MRHSLPMAFASSKCALLNIVTMIGLGGISQLQARFGQALDAE